MGWLKMWRWGCKRAARLLAPPSQPNPRPRPTETKQSIEPGTSALNTTNQLLPTDQPLLTLLTGAPSCARPTGSSAPSRSRGPTQRSCATCCRRRARCAGLDGCLLPPLPLLLATVFFLGGGGCLYPQTDSCSARSDEQRANEREHTHTHTPNTNTNGTNSRSRASSAR